MTGSGRHYPQAVWLERGDEPLAGDVLEPFALEELLCDRVRESGTPLIHVWRHASALVIGLRDRRLPGAEAALAGLRRRGVSCAVRHSGGAAVPLDPGVLNVSVVLPKPGGRLRMEDDFRRMADWLEAAIALLAPSVRVGRGEVAGAYCPGSYDLAIGGRKFCGLAQRRKVHAYVVQAFVNVEGEGAARARRAAEFYMAAAGPVPADAEGVEVRPDRTVSLAEAAGVPGVEALLGALRATGGIRDGKASGEALSAVMPKLDKQVRELRDRYESGS